MKKKFYLLLIILFGSLLCGCGKNMTAKEAVRDYLEMYVTLDSEVVKQIDEFVSEEDLNEEQKKLYKEILKKEYSTLSYEIKDETYDGDRAYVDVNINVIALAKVQNETSKYLEENREEFNDENGKYDKNKYLIYKLSKMKEAAETINYEIEVKVDKIGNEWKVVQLSNEDLEKLHGIYEYEK